MIFVLIFSWLAQNCPVGFVLVGTAIVVYGIHTLITMDPAETKK